MVRALGHYDSKNIVIPGIVGGKGQQESRMTPRFLREQLSLRRSLLTGKRLVWDKWNLSYLIRYSGSS